MYSVVVVVAKYVISILYHGPEAFLCNKVFIHSNGNHKNGLRCRHGNHKNDLLGRHGNHKNDFLGRHGNHKNYLRCRHGNYKNDLRGRHGSHKNDLLGRHSNNKNDLLGRHGNHKHNSAQWFLNIILFLKTELPIYTAPQRDNFLQFLHSMSTDSMMIIRLFSLVICLLDIKYIVLLVIQRNRCSVSAKSTYA